MNATVKKKCPQSRWIYGVFFFLFFSFPSQVYHVAYIGTWNSFKSLMEFEEAACLGLTAKLRTKWQSRCSPRLACGGCVCVVLDEIPSGTRISCDAGHIDCTSGQGYGQRVCHRLSFFLYRIGKPGPASSAHRSSVRH